MKDWNFGYYGKGINGYVHNKQDFDKFHGGDGCGMGCFIGVLVAVVILAVLGVIIS